MAKYLLVQSRDPLESAEVARDYELATNLAKGGNQVTLFLVQNGVLPARKGYKGGQLDAAAAAGVEILGDEFSLNERGIPRSAVIPSVRVSKLDVVVDQLAEGRKALWL
jgi:predicted peroxiredoxin